MGNVPSLARVVTLVGLLVLTAACSRGSTDGGADGADSGTAPESAPRRVVVARPAAATGEDTTILPGTVEPWEMASLYARVSGYLETVLVDIGDEVAAGDPLAHIVVPEMTADLQRAEAQVEQEQAELALARLTHARLRSLRTTNADAIPQQDVDTAAAQVQVEEAQVRLAEAERDRLHTLGEFSHLTAPFAGRITRRVLHPGALVREGNSPGAEPVVAIARTDRLRLALEIPEALAPHVESGTPVRLRFDAFPGTEIDARVARLAGILDPATRSMRAEVDLTEGAARYRPGMYASVELRLKVAAGMLGLPSRAVRGHGDDRFVLVCQDGVLRRRPVVVAADDGRRALVARGLATADRVMVAGSPLARDDVRCKPVEEEAK